jgi:hypothetical protein
MILQEENRTHEAAIKEIEEKMANLEQQMKSPYAIEDAQNQMPSEPAQETPEPVQEVSNNINEYTSAAPLQESDSTNTQTEAEAPQETTRKKKRLF